MELHGSSPRRKRALAQDELIKILGSIPQALAHDDLQFASIVFTGWHCLMQLTKLVDPDDAT